MKKIKKQKENYTKKYGCMFYLFLIAPYIQLLFCLNSLEPFIFYGHHHFFKDFVVLIILCVAAFFLLKLYFKMANTWQKWVMYIYMLAIILQTTAGLIYKYYDPPWGYFSKEEDLQISHFIEDKGKLPKNMKVFLWNDSIGVIGKKTKIPAFDYGRNYNSIINDNGENKNSFKIGGAPDDFANYKSLITNKSITNNDMIDFWCWQYPDYLVYIYIKDFEAKNRDGTIGHCYIEFWQFYANKIGHFDPIIVAIIDGTLTDRYRKFYQFYQFFEHPTYVRRDLGNDPYFLIYQGKYKEAREGLKDLPPARREFCEKKLDSICVENVSNLRCTKNDSIVRKIFEGDSIYIEADVKGARDDQKLRLQLLRNSSSGFRYAETIEAIVKNEKIKVSLNHDYFYRICFEFNNNIEPETFRLKYYNPDSTTIESKRLVVYRWYAEIYENEQWRKDYLPN